jgi:hypothetical protein
MPIWSWCKHPIKHCETLFRDSYSIARSILKLIRTSEKELGKIANTSFTKYIALHRKLGLMRVGTTWILGLSYAFPLIPFTLHLFHETSGPKLSLLLSQSTNGNTEYETNHTFTNEVSLSNKERAKFISHGLRACILLDSLGLGQLLSDSPCTRPSSYWHLPSNNLPIPIKLNSTLFNPWPLIQFTFNLYSKCTIV